MSSLRRPGIIGFWESLLILWIPGIRMVIPSLWNFYSLGIPLWNPRVLLCCQELYSLEFPGDRRIEGLISALWFYACGIFVPKIWVSMNLYIPTRQGPVKSATAVRKTHGLKQRTALRINIPFESRVLRQAVGACYVLNVPSIC